MMLALRRLTRLATPSSPRRLVLPALRCWSSAPAITPPSEPTPPDEESKLAGKVREMSIEETLVLQTYEPRELLQRGKRIMAEYEARGAARPPQEELFARMLKDIMLEHKRSPRNIVWPEGIPKPGEASLDPVAAAAAEASRLAAKISQVNDGFARVLEIEKAEREKQAAGQSANQPLFDDDEFRTKVEALLDTYEKRLAGSQGAGTALERWLPTAILVGVVAFFVFDGFEKWKEHEMWKWLTNNRIRELNEHADAFDKAMEAFLAGAPALQKQLQAPESKGREAEILRAAIEKALPPASPLAVAAPAPPPAPAPAATPQGKAA